MKRAHDILSGTEHVKVLEQTMFTVIENFAMIENIKKHRAAAIYFYHLIHSEITSNQLKQELEEAKSLEILKYNPHFSAMFSLNHLESEQLLYKEGVEAQDELSLQSGFTLKMVVPPKET